MSFSSIQLARIVVQLEGGDQELPDHIEADLELVFGEIAFAYAKTDSDHSLEPASEFPGYLCRHLDEHIVYVPWPLCTLSPDEPSLSQLIKVGEQISIGGAQTFCISGSSAMLGAEFEVADLDFSQYVAEPPHSLLEELESFLEPNDAIVAMKVTYGDYFERYPWPNRLADVTDAMREDGVSEAKRLMVDFLARTAQFGSLPVSNVILCCDLDDPASGAAQLSWTFQETLVVRTDEQRRRPIWQLSNPVQLAGFVGFLRVQMTEYMEIKPLKAAKRALMLSRVLLLHDFATNLLGVLKQPESRQHIQLARAEEVRSLAIALDDFARRQLVIEPEAPMSNADPSQGLLAGRVAVACKELITTLEIELAKLFTEARRLNGAVR